DLGRGPGRFQIAVVPELHDGGAGPAAADVLTQGERVLKGAALPIAERRVGPAVRTGPAIEFDGKRRGRELHARDARRHTPARQIDGRVVDGRLAERQAVVGRGSASAPAAATGRRGRRGRWGRGRRERLDAGERADGR